MALVDDVQKDLISAMKAGDSAQVDILKIVVAALKNAQIAKPVGEKMTKEEEIKVFFAEAKKVKDSIDQFTKAGRDDLADREKEQLQYVEKYLPEQASKEDIGKEVDKAINELQASGMRDMGRVMGVVMKNLQGKADGSLVNQIVKEKLSE